MKRGIGVYLGICATLFVGWGCFAQIPITGAGVSGAAVGYSGPGDIQSGALSWRGLRAYNAAYATGRNPAADICDVATGLTCTTINILSNGNFDVATAQASASCAVSCNVSKLYDQTGNGRDFVQTTNSARPVLNFNCLNTNLPCLVGDGTNSWMNTSSALVRSQPYFFSAVALRSSNTGGFGTVLTVGAALGMWFSNSPGGIEVDCTSGVRLTGQTENAWHALLGVCNGTSSILYVDGSNTGNQSGGTSSANSAVFIFSDKTTISDPLTGKWVEGGIWGTTPSSAATIISNQRAYWGF